MKYKFGAVTAVNKAGPKKKPESYWRADVGHKRAICPMRDACLSAHVPVTLTQFGNLAVATNTDEQIFVVLGACQQNIAGLAIQHGSLRLCTFSVFPDLISSPPESVRCSRKSVTFSSYASSDSTEGVFHVAHVTSPISLKWGVNIHASNLFAESDWDYLKSIALTHSSSKSMPIAALRSPKTWSLKHTSAIGAATWKNFDSYPFAGLDADKQAANEKLQEDLKSEAQSALVFYFPQTTSAQSIEWRIYEQMACRFPASGVMSSLNTNSADHVDMRGDPPSAFPHQGAGGYA